MVGFEQLAAALYLAAGIAAMLGLALPAPRVLRGSRWGLLLGVLAQALALATLHRRDPAPALTDLAQAIAFTAWVGVIFFLVLSTRYRLPGFAPPLALVAFLAAFAASLETPSPLRTHPRLAAAAAAEAGGSLPHAHVLLASAGLAALGLAGLAGLFFLFEHRALKRRSHSRRWMTAPSLEALDRVNRAALAVGFSLLSVGVVTGALWLESRTGQLWSGSLHETWTAIAWFVYLGLVVLRFAGAQRGREAAASAVAGFVFLLFAVVGVGLVS